MNKDNLELSRRKLLAGVGTAGVAAAGAGLGTTAYLNDTESLDDNVMTAGELDLILDYVAQYNQSGVIQPDGTEDTVGDDGAGTFQFTTGSRNGDAGSVVQLNDVKPGDCGYLVLCPRIVDNPGYLSLRADVYNEDGGANPEPEREVEDNGENDADLQEYMNVDVSYVDASFSPGEGPAEDACEAISTSEAYVGEPGSIASGNAAGVGTQLWNEGAGVQLDADPSTDDIDAFPGSGGDGSEGPSESAPPCIAFEFAVNEDVGNVIQGDSFDFDIEFAAEQARHNDASGSPFTTQS